ncbi:MAG TPA: dTDP-4-dehydrorhamnose 3,5-epimerase family protein [Candidatus Bathyarchaeia archaeon]|nr:dTDP-4-dehydrorhamnose 3,5-epimerase family protein [Candidatus Bathyarchaeia archaeon]
MDSGIGGSGNTHEEHRSTFKVTWDREQLAMLPGVRAYDLRKNVDERGFFAEILRDDWLDFLGDDKIVQANLSFTHPGMIRAWHRHDRGQVDYFAVLKGALKICAYDDKQGSPTRGQLDEVVASGERLQVVRIPGGYWHGTKTLGGEPSLTVYFVNRLYDLKHPDEERRPWNDPAIVDPKTSKPFDWNKPPHK